MKIHCAKILLTLGSLQLAIACGTESTNNTPAAMAGAGAGGAAGAAAGADTGFTAGASGGDSAAAGAQGGVAGTAGSGNAGTQGEAGAGGAAVDLNPMLLSQTGLYADTAAGVLQAGVLEFQPQYALWSDGSSKRRWVKLPEGSKIDTSNMNFWQYPNDTKLWKEFTRDGVRIETRLLWKHGAGDWFMMAYRWNAEQTEATAVPDGELNAAGTAHDVPTQEDCGTCHSSMRDIAIGFSALQLSHDLPGLNLSQLAQMGALSVPPAAPFVVPGSAAESAAIGYLHANCGMCHNARAKVYVSKIKMDLWLQTDKLASVEETPTYLTLVGEENTKGNILGTTLRVTPGDPAASALYQLMSTRDAHLDAGVVMPSDAGEVDGGVASLQMPPIGTEIVDPAGLASISAWIESLAP